MGRGIARKAELTKKCSCNNPKWYKDDIEVNGRTYEISYILMCSSCGANWKTKKPEARLYWRELFNKVPVVWRGGGYNGTKTVKELFADLDWNRYKFLENEAAIARKRVQEAEREYDKAAKAVEKHRHQINKTCKALGRGE